MTSGVPAQTFKPTKQLLEESWYVNQSNSVNWNVYINQKFNAKFSNLWTKLYNKQKGLCPLCNYDLGYFNSENLEVHHKKQVSIYPELVHKFENLQLVHKSCHITVPILKSKK